MNFTMGTFTLKDVSIVSGFLIAGASFYYSTSFRLQTIEAQAAEVVEQQAFDDSQFRETNDRLIRIEANIDFMLDDLRKIEEHLENQSE